MSNLRQEVEKYTYADYCKWDDDQRWELIDGIPYAMAAPSVNHQQVAINLSAEFRIHLKGKKCRVFASPIDVRLNADKGDDTVVQPDLIVVCDPKKIIESSIVGAPDLVIEVLSPSTERHDKVRKLAKYRDAGVGEIWLVNCAGFVEVYKNRGGILDVKIYDGEDEITPDALPDLTISLTDVFEGLTTENL